jgi:hypothetical protein
MKELVWVSSRNGPRAALPSGMEVWEVIRWWKLSGENWEKFIESFEDKTEDELRLAIDHYAANPDWIEWRLAREELWTEERAREWNELIQHLRQERDQV